MCTRMLLGSGKRVVTADLHASGCTASGNTMCLYRPQCLRRVSFNTQSSLPVQQSPLELPVRLAMLFLHPFCSFQATDSILIWKKTLL